MAEQKHTSGPWEIETVPTQVGHAHKINPVGACLYVDKQFLPHDDINSDSVEAAANARLIAASPDLYEALKEYKLGYTDADLKQLAETKSGRGEISPDVAAREIRRRAAIARVEGDGE